jgi:hypothetical protein
VEAPSNTRGGTGGGGEGGGTLSKEEASRGCISNILLTVERRAFCGGITELGEDIRGFAVL